MGTSSWNGYERNCLFMNLHDEAVGRFSDMAWPTGAAGMPDGRAVAVADLDADGGLDLVVANNGAPPTIYRNRLAPDRHWLRLRLVATASNPGAIGARVTLTAGGVRQTRWVEAGSGYAAQSAAPVHFGLGDLTAVEGLEVAWPSGRITRLAAVDLAAFGIDRQIDVVEGASPVSDRLVAGIDHPNTLPSR